MIVHTHDASPLFQARAAGLCWLVTIVTSAFAMFHGGRLVDYRDAAATASSILANEGLFRSATAMLLVSTVFYAAATLLVYDLLKPVNRSVSLLAACLSLVGCAIGAVACIFDLVPFLLLQGNGRAEAFSPVQLQGFTLLALELRVQANNLGLVFFGLHCLLVGCLILRSTFLPRVVGALMVFAGLGWLTFLSPPLAMSLAPLNMVPGAIGELTLTLWLIVAGVDVPKWIAQAGTEHGSPLDAPGTPASASQ